MVGLAIITPILHSLWLVLLRLQQLLLLLLPLLVPCWLPTGHFGGSPLQTLKLEARAVIPVSEQTPEHDDSLVAQVLAFWVLQKPNKETNYPVTSPVEESMRKKSHQVKHPFA